MTLDEHRANLGISGETDAGDLEKRATLSKLQASWRSTGHHHHPNAAICCVRCSLCRTGWLA